MFICMHVCLISTQVTDELFDEIATKVLDEDDLAVEGDYLHSPLPTPTTIKKVGKKRKRKEYLRSFAFLLYFSHNASLCYLFTFSQAKSEYLFIYLASFNTQRFRQDFDSS